MKYSINKTDNGGALEIHSDHGFLEFTIPDEYVRELIEFIRSDSIIESKDFRCIVADDVYPHCTLDSSNPNADKCAFSKGYKYKKECPHWKELNFYDIKE